LRKQKLSKPFEALEKAGFNLQTLKKDKDKTAGGPTLQRVG
jgi:hypothetical protein